MVEISRGLRKCASTERESGKEDDSLHGLQEFAAFCELAFSEKPNPPDCAFFANKVKSDPVFRDDLVFVGHHNVDQENVPSKQERVMACTLRIFDRKLAWTQPAENVHKKECNDSSVKVPHCWSCKVISSGGFGEVCTALNFRRRGFSRKLLQTALDELESGLSREFQASHLHASAGAAQALYASLGFRTIQTTKCVFQYVGGEETVQPKAKASKLSFFCEKIDKIDNSGVLSRCADVYSKCLPFSGSVLRSCDYWHNWVARSWTCKRKRFPRLFVLQSRDEDSQDFAYLYTFVAKDRLVVGEYACCDETNYSLGLHRLLRDVLSKTTQDSCDGGDNFFGELEGQKISHVVCPAPVAVRAQWVDSGMKKLVGAAPFEFVSTEIDKGWMYRASHGHTLLDTDDHVVWSADEF